MVHLLPSAAPTSVSAHAVGCVRLGLAATLPGDVDHPESQEVFGSKLEACLQCGRGCCLWSRLPFFPSPLLPASCSDGPVRRRLALLWNCSVPLFCGWPAVCSGWLTFSLSLAIPQFKLLYHVSSLRLPSGHSGRSLP